MRKRVLTLNLLFQNFCFEPSRRNTYYVNDGVIIFTGARLGASARPPFTGIRRQVEEQWWCLSDDVTAVALTDEATGFGAWKPLGSEEMYFPDVSTP